MASTDVSWVSVKAKTRSKKISSVLTRVGSAPSAPAALASPAADAPTVIVLRGSRGQGRP